MPEERAAEPDEPRPRARRELTLALACFSLCMAWLFRGVWLGGEVYSSGLRMPPEKGVVSIYEQAYQNVPNVYTAAREVWKGVFPAWTPLSQGGAPLLGKMVPGILAPHNLPVYMLPLSWAPYLFTFILFLKCFLTFLFAYLFARSLRLSVWGGVFTGLLFIFTRLFEDHLNPFWSSALFLPLLLLLVELYFRKQRRLALLLLPWAAGLPWIVGHFETSLRIELVAGIYFLYHLYLSEDIPRREKWRHAAAFAGVGSLGLVLASPQIVAGSEYLKHSYNQVWRGLPEFGWIYRTLQKHLTLTDLPVLGLGLACAVLGGWLLRPRPQEKSLLAPRSLARKAGAAAALAFGIALLGNVGLEDSGARLSILASRGQGLHHWLGCLFLMYFAFWSLTRPDVPRGRRALGWILAGSVVVALKMPPFSNLLGSLPVFGRLNNTTYQPELELARAVLCWAGVQECAALWRASREERLRTALAALLTLAPIAAAYAAAEPLERWAARTFTTSVIPSPRGVREPGGGIMGPEHQDLFTRRLTVPGWVSSYPEPQAVYIGTAEEPAKAVQAELHKSGRRTYFHAEVPLPPEYAREQRHVFARVLYRDGRSRTLRGPLLDLIGRPKRRLLCLLVLLFPLAILAGPYLAGTAAALLVLLCATFYELPTIAPEQFPYRLEELDGIRKDDSLFRITSLRPEFFSADFGAYYGLADIRAGDNLDVLSMLYYQRLAMSFLSGKAKPEEKKAGLELLGAANVKYLLDSPDAEYGIPGLKLLRRGKALSVWLNERVLPRAAFYDRHLVAPIGDIYDWRNQDRVYGPLAGAVLRKDFDASKVLVLHEPPQPPRGPLPAGSTSETPRVSIEEYRADRVLIKVDTPEPGFVFLADTFYPGWKAVLNDRPAPILRAYLDFRAVAVPPGRSTLEFVYRPPKLILALLASAFLCFVWVLAFLRFRPRLDRADPEPLRPEPRRKKKKRDKQEPTPAPVAAVEPEQAFLARGAAFTLLPYALVPVGFWAVWSACVYQGSILIRAAAWAAIACAGAYGLLRLRSGPQGQ